MPRSLPLACAALLTALTADAGNLKTSAPAPQPAPSLPGDHNADSLVNAADYTVWRDR